MKRRVAITGLGLVSSQGQDPQAAFDAWMKGQSAVGWHDVGEAPHATRIPAANCDADLVAVLGKSRVATMDRFSQLGAVAAGSAWQDAGLQDLTTDDREQVAVLWGTGGGGVQTTERSYRDLFVRGRSRISPLSVVLGMNNAAASHIALQLGAGGACLTYSVACASSAIAIGEAMRRIQQGDCEIALAGGAEAAMPYGTVKAWESLQVLAMPGEQPIEASCRPFHAERKGLVLGEGAAALVLEDWERAQNRGARIYAELVGYASTCDHSHMTMPNSQGQFRALQLALADAKATPDAVTYVNAHGTATREGDPSEIEALKQLLGEHAARTMISATKSMHGHLLGAAGAIEALITALAVHRDAVPPTAHLDQIDPACVGLDHVANQGREQVGMRLALSNSFAFGGSNAVLVMRPAA
ncbi:MAG TPA: beta-ketoacyl-[acyl-carrier-protein] synthase family protein [Aquabacterium sp.]|nr:beta-ketoacyl-[acyl-carrier-protein] synthase family protein [Aquabacterium sp.]